jgi:hypothetical protein
VPALALPRINDHGRSLAAVRLKRCSIELDRRRGELVLREYSRAGDGLEIVGRKQCHVETAPLDARVTSGRDEPLGRGYAHG